MSRVLSVSCPLCLRHVALTGSGFRVMVSHGPRGNRCPGSGRSTAETKAIDNEIDRAARAQDIDGDAFKRGWRRWCRFGDLESCKSDDERKGWEYAARENELGGNRPKNSEAADAFADFIRLGAR